MKAVTLWQPWASLVVAGPKHTETRSWHTNYRGTLAIHAAKLRPLDLERAVGMDEYMRLCGLCERYLPEPLIDLPRGAIIGTVELIDCATIIRSYPDGMTVLESFDGDQWIWSDAVSPEEQALGDYTLGRWGWVLREPVTFAEPVPWRGKQGLWNLPDEWVGAPQRADVAP